MSAARLNLKIEQGATFSHRLIWKDANKTPIDLTGYLAKMHVREDKASVDVLTELTIANNRITLGGVNGTIDLSITATDTAASTGAVGQGLEMPLAGNFNQATGTLFIEFECNYNKADIASNLGLVSVDNVPSGPLYQHVVSHIFRSYDGTNLAGSTQQIEKNTPYKAAVRWNKHLSKMQIIVNGVAGTEVTYDGAFTEGDMIRFLYGGAYTAYIKNVYILGTNLGTAECIQLTG